MIYFINKATDLPLQEVFPGITGHLIHTKLSTIADFRIAKGTELPEHAHPHEQTSTVLEGRFLFTVGGETRELAPGDVAVIPGGVAHSGIALTDCRIMDVFAPVREDYRVPVSAPEYQPVDCGFYDHFEAAIVQRRLVTLEFLEPNGSSVTKQIRLLDLKTDSGEEFVQLEGGEWLRLDRVVALDGVAAGTNCRS